MAIVLVVCLLGAEGACVHDHFAGNATYHYYNDLPEDGEGRLREGRLLQATTASTGSNWGRYALSYVA